MRNPRHALARLILVPLVLLMTGISCSFPHTLLFNLFPSPTPTLTATNTYTPTPSQTPTSTSTATATFTPTSTSTPTSTPITPTATTTFTLTYTPVPPTWTPGPSEITSGQDSWRLALVDYPHTIEMQGGVYYPGIYGIFYANYSFVRLNFECLTHTPLLSLYTGSDLGLIYAHRPGGIPDVWLLNPDGNTYPVTLVGPCWLAASIPSTDLVAGEYTLLFKDLPEFHFIATGLQ